MRLFALAMLAFAALGSIAPNPAKGRISGDFGIYCVRGRLQVDQKRIEELKSLFGTDVCRLEQDQTEVGAREKAHRLGGIGSTCSCD